MTPTLSAAPRADCFNLEDDDDIRILLDRAHSSTSSIFPEITRRPATSGVKRFGKMRPESSHGRSQATGESPPARGSPSSRCKDFVRRPQTAGAGGRIRSSESSKINPAGVVQLRREMLIRSHGEGSNLHLFPAEPFKTTAMGRKECAVDPGRRRTEVRKARETAASRANFVLRLYVCRYSCSASAAVCHFVVMTLEG